MPVPPEVNALLSSPVRGQAEAERLMELVQERVRRRMESLVLYRPMPTQLPFHLSIASERVVRGGNRSGKSMAAFAEFASAVTGQPIIGPDGQPLPFKYPTDRPMLAWVIGYDERHIGGTIFRMLFMPRAFKIIRDEQTGEWRSWNPNDARDKAREEETKFAPPLIPPRMIDPKGWGWKDKAERVFSVCRLRNGTEIHAFSSKAQPKQGDPVDLILIDEDIEYPKHVAEWEARLSDLKGRLIWSAWPHSKNEALVNMCARAEEQADDPEPDVFQIVLKFSDNPHIDAKEKAKRRRGWSEDEIRTRDSGEFLTDTVLMYPTFSIKVHGVPNPFSEDEVDRVILAMGNQVPNEWTHFMVLDPGHAHPAVLFAAITPPDLGDHVVLYDELYPRSCDADKLAELIAQKAMGKRFEAFIIDGHAGRQTPMGFSCTVQERYSQALERQNVLSHLTGFGFIRGSDNVQARAMAVRDWLQIRGDGTTKLLIVSEACPETKRQFGTYRKKLKNDEVTEEPLAKGCDLMHCVEYLAAYQPVYVPPRPMEEYTSPAWREFQRWKQSAAVQEGGSIYMGAGANPAAA